MVTAEGEYPRWQQRTGVVITADRPGPVERERPSERTPLSKETS
jgi:hypothetical protein